VVGRGDESNPDGDDPGDVARRRRREIAVLVDDGLSPSGSTSYSMISSRT